MKIKNIRQFRTFFKTEIRKLDTTRNEHFIGSQVNTDEGEKYGWFDIYHGRTPSIRNYLKGFLEMAGDGQAIYEFLQNAVDAKSSHFYMKWANDPDTQDDYLLICNNGKAFDLNSVISILNVGESTKYQNENSIGEYGIGFKLAHKLVGSKNGLDELMNEYRGPILFSWNNANQLTEFISSNEVEPSDFQITKNGDQWITKDKTAWLFKILLTCFPLLPENNHIDERISDLSLQTQSSLFSKNELQRFRRWVKIIYPILLDKNYTQGTIIFIKLGEGKRSVFSTKDLKSGIRFSLGILDELKKGDNFLEEIKFNDEEGIQKPSLNYEKYIISKDKVNGFSKEELKSDIEYILGYRPYNEIGKYFQNKPNFFLFFPLSVEIHHLNFIVHCNHFGKSSSRTHLEYDPNQSGINEKLFKALVYKLRDSLRNYANLKNSKFLDIYAALLSSRKNPNQDRKWVVNCFIDPFNKVLQEYIPIKHNETFETTTEKENVYIKQTALDFKPKDWGYENTEWFYFELPEFIAPAKDKLKLKTFGLFDVLKKKDIYHKVNNWIDSDRAKARTIIEEISKAIKSNLPRDEEIKNNLINLKLIHFSNGEIMSLQELESCGNKTYIVLYDGLEELRLTLEKIGLICSSEDFSDFSEILSLNYLGNNFQLRNKSAAIQIVNSCDKKRISSLDSTKRMSLFNALYKRLPEGKKTEEISNTELFRNVKGEYQKLGSLLGQKKEVWLNRFCIHDEDNNPQISNFLLSDDDRIYDKLIQPYYPEVFNEIALSTQIKTGLSKIKEYYELSSVRINIEPENIFFYYKNQICNWDITKNLFIDKGLKKLDESTFNKIQSLVDQEFNLLIPDQVQLDFLLDKPWSCASVNPVLDLNRKYTKSQLTLISKLDSICRLDLLKQKTFKQHDELFELVDSNDSFTFYSEDGILVKFLQNNLADHYTPLLQSLFGISFSNVLTGEFLIKSIVKTLNELNDDSLIYKFLLAIQNQSPDHKNIATKSLRNMYIDLKEPIHDCGMILSLYEDLNSESKEIYKNKIIFELSNKQIALKEIDSLDDRVVLELGSSKVSLSRSRILGLDDKLGISDIDRLVQYTVGKDLIRDSSIDELFNRQAKSLNQELINSFLASRSDCLIENADQLLVLLYSDLIDAGIKEDFEIYNRDDDLIGINCNFVLYNETISNLVDPTIILNSSFNDLGDYLAELNQPYFEFKINDEDYFISPTIPLHKELSREFFCKELNEEVLWSYLYHETEKQKIDVRWKWNTFKDVINPTEFLVESKFENELLPSHFSNRDSIHFLKRIGVDTHQGLLKKINKLISGDLFEIPEGISSLPPKFLINRIHKAGIDNIKFEQHGSLYMSLVKMFMTLFDSNFLATQIGFLPCLTSTNLAELVGVDEDIYRLNSTDYRLIKNNLQIQDEFFHKIKVLIPEISEKHTHLGNRVKTLSFAKEWNENQRYEELDERFYKEWKENNQEYSLYKLSDDPQFTLIISTHTELLMGTVIYDDHFYCDEEDEDNISIYYNPAAITFEKLSEESGHYCLDDMIETRIKYLEEFARAMANNFDSYSDEQRGFMEEESFKKRKDRIRKEKVAALQSNDIQFSFDWFSDYLDLLHSYVDVTSLEKQVTIRFQSIKAHKDTKGNISQKYCMLLGADKVLFQSIENAENLTLVLKYGRKELKEYTVEGVYKIGQNLRAYYPQGFGNHVIASFKDVIDVEIKFTPSIDLIGRLKKAFHEYLEDSAWEHIASRLPAVNYIYGPPGTGKTTTLCKVILDRLKVNPDSKILILTPTNKASDVIIKRLYKDYQLQSVKRIGNPTDTELFELDESVYTSILDKATIEEYNVIGLTIHRLPYLSLDFNENSHPLYDLDDLWDMVIFDETSMIGVEYMVFALCAFSTTSNIPKILIAGDPKQIPPVLELNDLDLEKLEINELNLYKIMGLDDVTKVHKRIRDIDDIKVLKTQYRSVPSIGNLFSHFSYNGILSHHRDKELNMPFSKNLDYLNESISFIDLPLEEDNSVLSVAKLNYSSYHLYSCFLITEILREIDKNNKKHKIGIISPYKAQAVIINKLIASSDLSENIDYLCDTVHGFQGDERDTIIFILNPNNYRYTGHPRALIAKDYIYNVAISRARDRLIILSPIRDYPNPKIGKLQQIDTLFSGNKKVLESSKIEHSIFGEKNFIVNNSYVTGHDSVNVYGLVDIGYFIKKNSNSVDVQIQKGISVLTNDKKELE